MHVKEEIITTLNNLPTTYYIIFSLILVGLIGLFSGISMTSYKGFLNTNTQLKVKKKRNTEKLSRIFGKVTNLPMISTIKNSIKKAISYSVMEDYQLNIRADIMTIIIIIVSVLMLVFLWGIGQLWYTKVLIVALSLFFPYYVLTFVLDIIKWSIQKQIPVLIDEFTSAFVSTPRVKDALLETSKRIDKKFGNILANIADSPYVENGLDDTWLNIFVTIIINHRTSGGDLVKQLYKLKSTVARYNKIQKKKDKRLVGYEIFAVIAAVFSVPLVFYVNTAMLGSDVILVDAQSNLMISNIILSSIFALVIMRMLRRM